MELHSGETKLLAALTLRLCRVNLSWFVSELLMIDNNSERDGSFSFPDADNGVARACLISVKQTEYKNFSLVAASLK